MKSLGFQGGNKHDTGLNQWINHEKKVLAEIAKEHGIEWEQKGTHEEHLDVYNIISRKKNVKMKEYGTVKAILPETGTLERATAYRDKKIKLLFIQMKNKIAAMAVQVKEFIKEVGGWRHKYQKTKQAYNQMQRKLDTVREEKMSSYLRENNNCRMFPIDMTGQCVFLEKML